MQPQSQVDKIFMRGKDALLILGILGSIFVWAIRYYSLPGEISAQAQEIKLAKADINELKNYTIRTDGRLSRIEDGQAYTNKSLDRVEGWLKGIASRQRNENP